jgi:sugar transferase (PEP-CTERM system associated)
MSMNKDQKRVLVLGTAEAGITLVRELLARPELNVKVVGFLDEKGENIGKSLVNPSIIGSVDQVGNIVKKEAVNQVILSLNERRGCTPVEQLLQLKFSGVQVEDVHSMYEKVTGKILLANLEPSWLFLSTGFRKSPFLLAAKRGIDIAMSMLGIILGLPLMGVIALAIWLETGLPILFRQERVGLGQHPFTILKFRSMFQNAEAGGPSWAQSNDPRITRIGRLLRKYRLDELPQLFNVLRGEMSFVGPRPEQTKLCQMLQEMIPLYQRRHSVRPGVTGWAQVKYQYGSTVEDAKRKLEYEFYYIKNLSLKLDLAIILATFKVILFGRGAK